MQSAGYVRRCAGKAFSDPGSIPGASTLFGGCYATTSRRLVIATPALRKASVQSWSIPGASTTISRYFWVPEPWLLLRPRALARPPERKSVTSLTT